MSSSTTSRSRKRLTCIGDEPPLRRARRDVLSCELESVQAELEHERSLRALDSRRFVQTKQRLEKQMDFAMEEAKDSKALMEEMREENERHLEQLKRAMGRTKAELQDIQADLDEARAIASRKALEEDPRIAMLEEGIEAKSIENDSLKDTICKLRSEMKNILDQQSAEKQSDCGGNELSLSPGAIWRLRARAQPSARPSHHSASSLL